jgi:phospholipid/cholesterol/gamma-HCH transport system substrate-binding protein
MRKAVLVLAIIVLAAGCLLGVFHGRFHHKLELVTYLADAEGLRRGATVRMKGLDVGRVADVKLTPDRQGSPVKVIMLLDPAYHQNIPNDSKVRLSTAGILGETYVLIDIAGASGTPVVNHAVLKSEEATALSYSDALEKITEALKHVNCDDLSPEKSKLGGKK